MATVEVKCPTCNGIQVYKYRKSRNGTQRYLCHAQGCPRETFRLEYRYEGAKPGINEKIIAMTTNAHDIRDTARVLKISTDKVMDTLKNESSNKFRQPAYINEHPNIERLRCNIVPYYEVAEAELDEMWSYVFSKENPRWLWPDLDYQNRQILAYTFGQRKDKVFRSIQPAEPEQALREFLQQVRRSFPGLIPRSLLRSINADTPQSLRREVLQRLLSLFNIIIFYTMIGAVMREICPLLHM